MRGNEEFQNGQAFTEVCTDRNLDDLAVRVSHETAHAGELTDLRRGTTGTGIRHHVDRIERIQRIHQSLGNAVRGLFPDVDHALAAFVVAQKTASENVVDLDDLLFRFRDHVFLLGRNLNILETDGNTAACGVVIAEFLDLVQRFRRLCRTVLAVAVVNNITEILLHDEMIDLKTEHIVERFSRYKTEVLRDGIVENDLTDRRVYNAPVSLPFIFTGQSDLDPCLKRNITRLIRHDGFVFRVENLAFSLCAVALQSKVIAAHDHILRRGYDRTAVLRLEDIVGRQHKEPCLGLRFYGQRYMDSHLVAVEVGVERGTYQGMEFDRAAFDKNGFERLDAESVERRSTVQQNRMILDHVLESAPDFVGPSFDHSLRAFHILRIAVLHQVFHDKRLEQFQSHLLRETALVHLQFRTDHDNGTAGIVYTFAQQVLTETSLFAPQHVGQGFQRPVAGSGDRTASAAVVDQSVDRFLQHTLFVADNDVGRTELKKFLESVVPVDDPAVKIVQIARSEPAAVQLDHRPEIRRDDRDNGQNDPFRSVAALDESFHDFQPLDRAGSLLAGRICDLVAEFFLQFLQVQIAEQFADGFRAHARAERLRAVLVDRVAVFLVREDLLVLQTCFARIRNNICRKIQHLLKCARAHVQQHLHAARDPFEIPDVGYRNGKFDMSHPFASYFGARHFNAALFADDSLISSAFVSAAMALPVLCRSENAFAVQTVFFRL